MDHDFVDLARRLEARFATVSSELATQERQNADLARQLEAGHARASELRGRLAELQQLAAELFPAGPPADETPTDA